MNLVKLGECLLVLMLLLAGGQQTVAQTKAGEKQQTKGLMSTVKSDSKVTYFDLLRNLFPDLQADGTATKTIPFRSMSNPRKREATEGGIKFDFKPYWFNSEGRRLLLLWVHLEAEGLNAATPYEGEAAVLAVFELEPKIQLLDALDIQTDRFPGFWKDRPVFRLNSRNDAFIVYSSHWNSGESYNSIEMLFVDGGKLKPIASLFTYETQGCGANFTETPEFRSVSDPGKKYPKVLIKVSLRRKPDDNTCEHPLPGFTRYYQGLFSWNAGKGRYENSSRQLDSLLKFNRLRISSP